MEPALDAGLGARGSGDGPFEAVGLLRGEPGEDASREDGRAEEPGEEARRSGGPPRGRGAGRTSGRRSRRTRQTASVTRPSTRPMARWIGSIAARKGRTGSAAIPETAVSATTPRAPSWSATTAPRTRPSASRPRAQQGPGDERRRDERGEDAEVPDVRAEGEEAAVGEEERLDEEDRRHDDDGGVRAEEEGEEEAAAEVAARAGAGNREVDHLRREDEGAGHSHERREALLRPVREPAGRTRHHGGGRRPERAAHGGGEEGIGHVHRVVRPTSDYPTGSGVVAASFVQRQT